MELADMKVEKDKFQITELGKFPKEWCIESLENCCSKITDGTHDTPQKVSHGIPYITAIHVKEAGIDFDNCYYLPEETHRSIYRRCNPEYHDILMVNIGAGVGTTSIVDVDYEFSLKNVALLKPNKRVTTGTYLNFVLTHFKTKIISKLLSGGAQDFLSLSKISKIKIPLPPTLEEQRAIAEALSDVDALIAGLDALIEKKQQVKKGAMQQLLTGRKRLPGFDGEWEEKTLSQVCSLETGKRPRGGVTEEGDVPSLGGENIKREGGIKLDSIKRVSYDFYDSLSSGKLKHNDVLINKDGANTGKVGLYNDGLFSKACINEHLFIVRGHIELFNEYLYYYLNLAKTKAQIEKQITSSAQPGINSKFINNVNIEIPTLEEQKAIAQILTDMDAEIQALQSKRDKYEQIKQGMMQELLTGKTRLV